MDWQKESAKELLASCGEFLGVSLKRNNKKNKRILTLRFTRFVKDFGKVVEDEEAIAWAEERLWEIFTEGVKALTEHENLGEVDFAVQESKS